MFKLFKDLTRPPEPLSPRPVHSDPPSQPYTPRVARGRSPGPPSLPSAATSPNPNASDVVAAIQPEKEREETDGDAKRVVILLKSLQGGGEDVMHYVEILSQILIQPSTSHTYLAFRRHRGLEILTEALEHGLSWTAPSGEKEEERQVMEVQRMEGLRVALEVLGKFLDDRETRKAFHARGGHASLLPTLRSATEPPALPDIVQSTSVGVNDSSSSTHSHTSLVSTPRHSPDVQVLALILAHIFNDNYSILSILKDPVSLTTTDQQGWKEKLGDLNLRRGEALPLLWGYLWGLGELDLSQSAKGKGKETSEQLALYSGESETGSDPSLIHLVFQILLTASHTSAASLFTIRQHLPGLTDFLMTRLYGFPEERKYEITFPARPEWYENVNEDEWGKEEVEPTERAWSPPEANLRKIYLALLRRVLEAGVDQSLVWRLFSLVKVVLNPSKLKGVKNGRPHFGNPTGRKTPERSSTPAMDEPGSPSELESTPTKRKKRPNLPLRISTTLPPADEEKLQPEVLDLIRHAMKARWPPVFVMRGGVGDSEGGLEMGDMGRVWPAPAKGFNFSCWLYITKLNRPITLLHASQVNRSHPLFTIRILENSQIALFSSIYQPPSETEHPVPEELICAAPDALVPHYQWVHFAVGLRKPKGADFGEARIFVNGVRVGAMKVPYPVPAPAPAAQPYTLSSVQTKTISSETIRLSVGRERRSSDTPKTGAGKEEENEWMLGRSILLEDIIPEDLVLLMHHLGPRYHGNFQEALGKFLTYEGATSINIYLSSLAQNASDKRLFTSASNSLLVKAVRQGPAMPEENILFSFSAQDEVESEEYPETILNAAIPHPFRAKQLRHGTAKLQGNVEIASNTAWDESISCVGGGTVILKMIDLSGTSEELASTLGILRDMVKDSWTASEEIERIRGFEMLAAILRPKMPNMMDVACTKIILSMLGINMDKPATATVHNSAAYRALALEFELWSQADLGVVSLYLQHFEYLLSTSKHARHNVLRTFQKAAMVRKMLFALRSGFFDLAVVPVVVDTLRLALLARWSGEDAIKPVFSYMISALCQSNSSFTALYSTEPPPSQAPAAQILQMISELVAEPSRLVKLNKSLALHRLLIIFISSNSAYYVTIPCLQILEKCLNTPGMESFQRSFEAEGGFTLLARTMGSVWRSDVQTLIFRMLFGTKSPKEKEALQAQPLISTILAALDFLLQTSAGDDEGGRPAHGRTRSGTITSIRSVAMTPIAAETNGNNTNDTRLEDLLSELTPAYRISSPFRRCITGRKIEQMLPAIADFAVMSASSNRPEQAKSQRKALANWLQALVEKSKASHALVNQMKLVIEQLRSAPTSPKIASSSYVMSPTSPRPSSSVFGGSFSGRLSSTPPASPSLGGPIPRRRPSADAGSFSPRMSMVRAPLKRVLTGESVLEGGRDKNAAWKLIIIQTDSQAHSKMTLERKEHWQRISETDWPKLAAGLRAENGLWPDDIGPVGWRLDGSEGPLRMRNRLERINAAPELGAQRTRHKLRDAIPSVDELSSAVSRLNVAPWEDPFALALGEAAPIEEEDSPLAATAAAAEQPPSPSADSRMDDESYIEVEENKDDKMRRIAKTLQAGDVVEEAHNIVRIVGVDACPGLLIFGKKNLYLVDGLVQTKEGEVIDAKDAPRDVLSVPGTLAEVDGNEQESHRWNYNEIVESNKRAFLFRDVALEMYFSDKRNFLIVFKDKRERQGVVTKLSNKSDQSGAISRSIIGNFVLDQVAKAMDRSEQQLEAMTRKWQAREISNFAYLQLLNQHANRTPNDVTQYPVFPWVLSDYTSQILDLDKSSSFRDLTFPMGALTPARREAALERYSATEGVGEQPFHYGTHYSSSMIVCGFMIRMSPFTEIFLALQGGNFDLADRLFSSIPRSWDSASADNRGDVRELIPEFFYSSSFLLNINHHDFGRKQVTGDSVDDVALPPWALEDPLLFTHRMREALESDYVSRHLSTWIDLTFGSKQRDPAAFNCFHPLSYRGAVDLESIEDESEKAASTAIIHNFGQTPLQIFKTPHPHRFMHGRSTLPINQRFGVAEQWQILFRSILPITETTTPVYDLVESNMPEAKPVTQMKHRLVVAGTHLTVQYGFKDSSLRIYYQELSVSVARVVLILEGLSIVHAIFAAPTLLVTCSEQGVLTAWRLSIKNGGYRRGDVSLSREGTLRGHDSPVTCLVASQSWSFLVSGAENGKAMVWDMNRLRYIRTLETPHDEPILFGAINEADGHIALASRYHLYIFSLNGHPIASTSVENDAFLPSFTLGLPGSPNSTQSSDERDEFSGGISFLKRDFLKFGPLFVIGINGEVALYRCLPGVKRFEDEEDVPAWKLVEQGRLAGSGNHLGGSCCMVKFTGETLYAAFEPRAPSSKYSLYQWSLPEGGARHVAESVSHTCMAESCGRHFGLLEPKRHCGGCGGVFCGTHAVHVETFDRRYCESCRTQLSDASVHGILANRRDSAYPTSRRGSIVPGSSQPGSRRPSFSGGNRARTASRSASRTPSRSVSRSASRRPSVSNPSQGHGHAHTHSQSSITGTTGTTGIGLGIQAGGSPLATAATTGRSREGTPNLMPPMP